MLSDFFLKHKFHDKKHNRLHITKFLNEITHCKNKITNTPFLIPPVWNKYSQQMLMKNIWKKASTELSDAKNIVICGYSLPQSDPFFRHLLAISLSYGQVLNHISFINPDKQAISRFESLISDSISRRCNIIENNFEESIGKIFKLLNIDYMFQDSLGGVQYERYMKL